MLSHRDTGVNMQALDFFRRNRNLAKNVLWFHYRDLEIIARRSSRCDARWVIWLSRVRIFRCAYTIAR